jgi:hypothetical protein
MVSMALVVLSSGKTGESQWPARRYLQGPLAATPVACRVSERPSEYVTGAILAPYSRNLGTGGSTGGGGADGDAGAQRCH